VGRKSLRVAVTVARPLQSSLPLQRQIRRSIDLPIPRAPRKGEDFAGSNTCQFSGPSYEFAIERPVLAR
jgi:hypothetical protein